MRCVQLLTEMDDLTEWFVETERQITDAEPLTSDLEKLREQQTDHKVIPMSFNLDIMDLNVKYVENSYFQPNIHLLAITVHQFVQMFIIIYLLFSYFISAVDQPQKLS